MMRCCRMQHPRNLVFCQLSVRISQCSVMSQLKRTHYDVLGITANASQEDIRNAFINLSKEIHPDTNPGDPHNHSKFVRLYEAYSVLSKIRSRHEYDATLSRSRRGNSFNQYKSRSDVTRNSHSDSVHTRYAEYRNYEAPFPDEASYGMNGIHRQSDVTVGVLSCVIIVLGVASFFGVKYSAKKRQESELITKKNASILKQVQYQARLNGNAKQIEELEARFSAAEAKRRSLILSADE